MTAKTQAMKWPYRCPRLSYSAGEEADKRARRDAAWEKRRRKRRVKP